jgi:ATP:ADP antiporter, AAA family
MIVIQRFLGVRPGEAGRAGSMAALLFFLLAANNIIKVVRDSLFLSHFPISQLPYVYLLTALVASVVISIYSHYTAKLSIAQVLLGSHAFIIANLFVFWMLVSFYHFDWVLYAFYVWSGIAGLVVVAQFWTLANDMFTPRDGKRLFGILTAGGTLGGLVGGVGANWAVNYLFATHQLLWVIVGLFVGAYGAGWLAARERQKSIAGNFKDEALPTGIKSQSTTGVVETLRSSRHLQLIAMLIFVSIIVSTLIDYQFKAAAKAAYPSMDALAGFFGSYYAWLSVVTVFIQLWLTGKLLMGVGLTPSLLLLPVTLLAGSFGILIWPGLWLATATRLSEASLRTSLNHSSVEILYLPIPDFIKKKVKVLLDVTVERVGDGAAAFIILIVTFFLGSSDIAFLSYVSIGLILVWVAIVLMTQRSYMEALRGSLVYREASLERARIDFADRDTVEAVLKTLEERDEGPVIFGLDLAANLDPEVVVARLPRSLIRHASSAVRSRAIKLFALHPDPATLEEINRMLQGGDKEVQAAAVSAASAIFGAKAIPVVRPYLESRDPKVRGQALECLLRYGDAVSRENALRHFGRMVGDVTPQGEPGRIEAARLIGEVYDGAFSSHLERLISEDRSIAVIRAAMAAAARGQDRRVIPNIIGRLDSTVTKNQAREALVKFGDTAVQPLRETLFDANADHVVRINIPRTLSKIPSQTAMDALLNALRLEDRTIRYKVILGLEEMARRFPTLRVNREMIEGAITSDAQLYFRRFVIYCVLFGDQNQPGPDGSSLLRYALGDSMERVKERVMWLLSVVYPGKDIRSVWLTLNSNDSTQRDYAIEFLDNLLAGQIKQHVFPLFSDVPQAERCKTALGFLGMDAIDAERALRLLLQQDDLWLTAATIWEIGIRGLGGFRKEILTLTNSENPVLRETVAIVMDRIPVQ